MARSLGVQLFSICTVCLSYPYEMKQPSLSLGDRPAREDPCLTLPRQLSCSLLTLRSDSWEKGCFPRVVTWALTVACLQSLGEPKKQGPFPLRSHLHSLALTTPPVTAPQRCMPLERDLGRRLVFSPVPGCFEIPCPEDGTGHTESG